MRLVLAALFTATATRFTPDGLSRAKERIGSLETRLDKAPTTVLDFFGIYLHNNNFIRDNFPRDFSPEAAWREMGVLDPSNKEELLRADPRTDQQFKLLMMALLRDHYQEHGEEVVRVMEEVSAQLNPNKKHIPPSKSSVAAAVKFGDLVYDEIGNPTIGLELSAKAIDGIISGIPGKVVNMSLELGQFSMTYELFGIRTKHPELATQGPSKLTINGETSYRDHDGKGISEEEYDNELKGLGETEVFKLDPSDRSASYLDGYAGEDTYANLQMLARIAGRHPDKFFIAAGGNPSTNQGSKLPDIRDARSRLEEQGLWPGNFIVGGFQMSLPGGFKFPASHGSDFYVSDKDLKKLGFTGASSFATPVITEIVRNIIARLGIRNHEQIKEILMHLTDSAEAWIGPDRVEYRLINFDLAKTFFTNLKRRN